MATSGLGCRDDVELAILRVPRAWRRTLHELVQAVATRGRRQVDAQLQQGLLARVHARLALLDAHLQQESALFQLLQQARVAFGELLDRLPACSRPTRLPNDCVACQKTGVDFCEVRSPFPAVPGPPPRTPDRPASITDHPPPMRRPLTTDATTADHRCDDHRRDDTTTADATTDQSSTDATIIDRRRDDPSTVDATTDQSSTDDPPTTASLRTGLPAHVVGMEPATLRRGRLVPDFFLTRRVCTGRVRPASAHSAPG